jgi:hypothetical protein
VTPVLALLGLLAQALAGYVLVVLALGSLCALPGWVGGVAGRIALLVTPAVVRHLVDLLVGGTLLAQTLAAAPGLPQRHRPPGPALALAGSSIASGWTAPGPGSVMGPPGPGSSRTRQVLTA